MSNEVIRQLRERKSMRVYTDQPIPAECKAEIIQAALEAPTAGNMCLYSILDITDQAIKDTLAVTCDDQPFIARAPLTLIFVADYRRWYLSYRLVCGSDVRKPAEGDLMLAACDALIAAQNTVVAAESLGIGSCYIGDILENYERHKALLNLPQYTMPVAMLCYGYPVEQQKKRAKPARYRAEHIVSENGYRPADEARLREMHDLVYGQGAFESMVKRTYERKWNKPFIEEMTRSVRRWMDDWTSG